jgi:hypothetical protein
MTVQFSSDNTVNAIGHKLECDEEILTTGIIAQVFL